MRTNQPKKNKASSGCETPARFVVVHLAEQAETTSSKLPPCYFFSKKEKILGATPRRYCRSRLIRNKFACGKTVVVEGSGRGSEEEEKTIYMDLSDNSFVDTVQLVLLQPLLHKNTPVHSEAS